MSPPHKPHTDHFTKAAFFCITAHFLFFIMAMSAKYLSSNHHIAEIAFYRNVLVFIPMLICIFATNNRHLFYTKKPKLVAYRAVIGGISLIVTYGAVALLPMAYATVLIFTSFLLTPVLSFFLLKEQVGAHRWFAVALGMLGVILIAHPSGEFSMLGLIFALSAAFLHALMYTLLRALKTEDPTTITLYFVLIGTAIPGFLFMPWVAKPIALDELWVFAIVGISGGLAQFFLANAYKYAPASFVTPFGYTALLWTVMADIFYWKYDIDLVTVFIGAGLILGAQLYMIHREYKNKHREIK